MLYEDGVRCQNLRLGFLTALVAAVLKLVQHTASIILAFSAMDAKLYCGSSVL
jgi:hypothetical protein